MVAEKSAEKVEIMSKTLEEKRIAIQEHIKEYYTIEGLKADCNAASTKNQIDLQGARHMVEGACFLVSYYEVKEFMDSIGFDKRYTEEHDWQLYIDEVAKAILKLCNE